MPAGLSAGVLRCPLGFAILLCCFYTFFIGQGVGCFGLMVNAESHIRVAHQVSVLRSDVMI